jgi:DNA ligase-4
LSDKRKRLEKIADIITTNGGKIVGLHEGKLTHVVLDKRDVTRRIELIKATSQ